MPPPCPGPTFSAGDPALRRDPRRACLGSCKPHRRRPSAGRRGIRHAGLARAAGQRSGRGAFRRGRAGDVAGHHGPHQPRRPARPARRDRSRAPRRPEGPAGVAAGLGAGPGEPRAARPDRLAARVGACARARDPRPRHRTAAAAGAHRGAYRRHPAARPAGRGAGLELRARVHRDRPQADRSRLAWAGTAAGRFRLPRGRRTGDGRRAAGRRHGPGAGHLVVATAAADGRGAGAGPAGAATPRAGPS